MTLLRMQSKTAMFLCMSQVMICSFWGLGCHWSLLMANLLLVGLQVWVRFMVSKVKMWTVLPKAKAKCRPSGQNWMSLAKWLFMRVVLMTFLDSISSTRAIEFWVKVTMYFYYGSMPKFTIYQFRCLMRSIIVPCSKLQITIYQLHSEYRFLSMAIIGPPVYMGLLLCLILIDVTKSLRFLIRGSPLSSVIGFLDCFLRSLDFCSLAMGFDLCIINNEFEYFYYNNCQIWIILKSIMQVFPYKPNWQAVQFKPTQKKIVSFHDVEVFQRTKIHNEYLQFLGKLQQAVQCKPISKTQKIQKFKIFQPYFLKLHQYLTQTPPIQQPMRFGNRAFKDWHQKACKHTQQFIQSILPQKIQGARQQLCRYVNQSWGSNVRIDYGTGHQMSFMFFCWSLYRLGFCEEGELENLVRQLFYEYIRLMRAVQVQYQLEPAGSHGVWGLDDYHFLPFLLGAAQMIGQADLESPDCINKDNIVEKYADDYMYLNCIRFIKQAKKGVAFHESSPILHNISGAASWEKVAGGMPKMYKVEVLGKHPVIKHQYFGTIIPFE